MSRYQVYLYIYIYIWNMFPFKCMSYSVGNILLVEALNGGCQFPPEGGHVSPRLGPPVLTERRQTHGQAQQAPVSENKQALF